MRTPTRLRLMLTLGLAAAIAAIVVAGCGGDDDDNGGTTAATPAQTDTGGGGATLTIEMGDYSFTPKNPSVAAGPVTISTPNSGQVEHELVLFKSDANPATLPTIDSEVDEEALEEQGADEIGEIEDVAPGESKSESFDLQPGKYVMICNLPGHYSQGMYGTLTAK